MPSLTDADKKTIARRYWRIKSAGTIDQLAAEFEITRPTVISYANQYREEVEAEEQRAGGSSKPSDPDQVIEVIPTTQGQDTSAKPSGFGS